MRIKNTVKNSCSLWCSGVLSDAKSVRSIPYYRCREFFPQAFESVEWREEKKEASLDDGEIEAKFKPTKTTIDVTLNTI